MLSPHRYRPFRILHRPKKGLVRPPRLAPGWGLSDYMLKKPACCLSRNETVDTKTEGPVLNIDFWGHVSDPKIFQSVFRR